DVAHLATAADFGVGGEDCLDQRRPGAIHATNKNRTNRGRGVSDATGNKGAIQMFDKIARVVRLERAGVVVGGCARTLAFAVVLKSAGIVAKLLASTSTSKIQQSG